MQHRFTEPTPTSSLFPTLRFHSLGGKHRARVGSEYAVRLRVITGETYLAEVDEYIDLTALPSSVRNTTGATHGVVRGHLEGGEFDADERRADDIPTESTRGLVVRVQRIVQRMVWVEGWAGVPIVRHDPGGGHLTDEDHWTPRPGPGPHRPGEVHWRDRRLLVHLQLW